MSQRGIIKIISVAAAVLPLLFLPAPSGGDDSVLLRLPVRVYVNSLPLTGLSRDDFTLRINGMKREIRNSLSREKVFSAPRGPRDLILALDAAVYGPQLYEGIAPLLARFVRQTDRFHILTPLNKYSIDMTADKTTAARRITRIIREDADRVNLEKNSVLENLHDTVENFIQAASGRKRGVKYTRNHARIMLFLSNFNRLWTGFRDNYLLPDMKLLQRLASELAARAGDRWMIHPLRPDPPGIRREFQKAAAVIRAHIDAAPSGTSREMTDSLRRGLQMVEESMSVRPAFPKREMLRSLIGAEITYLPLTLGDHQDGGGVSEHLAVLMNIARFTGGTHLAAANLTSALDRLARARDVHYDLVFPFDGRVEEKEIRVTVSRPGAKLWYKPRFPKGEIQILAKHMKEPEIRVLEFSITGRTVKFSVRGFRIEDRDTQKAGAVRVTVELVDDKHRAVYTTQNTLRAEREPITVSIDIPSEHRGYFQLRIEAHDILGRKTADIKKYVKL